jgi:hypothetical protein
MSLQQVKVLGGSHIVAVGIDPTDNNYYALPVNHTTGELISTSAPSTPTDILKQQDFVSWLALTKQVYTAGPSAAITGTVTGQTSFVATTPTFLLTIPAGITCIPLLMGLCQTGTVAGDNINILMGKDYQNRYSSGGTTLLAARDRDGLKNASCVLSSNPTATADTGDVPARMMAVQIAADISPAEGLINEVVWTPAGALDFLDGPAAWLIYTFAATTGPTWFYEFKWAELATSSLP